MSDGLDLARLVRWGILGAGQIAATVCADIAASPGSEVVAVGARDVDRARVFARRLGVRRAHPSYDDLVADPDVDVVYVATTHGQHHEHALLALRAGKPVLVEKAFALNAWQALEIVAEARARGLFCMEAMWMRHNPLVARAVEVGLSGRIGDVTAVKADLSRRFPYDPGHRLFDLAAGGGALLDLGVYPLNLVWAVLGPPSGLSATGRLAPTGADWVSGLQLSYPSGAVGQVLASSASDSPDTGVILGTEGWVRLDGRIHRPTSITVSLGDRVETVTGTSYGNSYGPEVAEVERCLRLGLTESPALPLDDTVAILATLDDARSQLGVTYPADRLAPRSDI